MTVVNVAVGAPASLDPANGYEHDGAFLLRFLSDPLVEFTPDGTEPRPAAAAGWRVDDDGCRVVFRLRPGVRFHHGRQVTAADYVYSLSRAVRPETDSKVAYNLSVVDGYEEVRSGAAVTLRGLRAIDPATLEVRLAEPFHEIAAVFSHRVTAAVPREVVATDPERFTRRPVGTGPYLLPPGPSPPRTLRLRRFAGYHGANAAFPGGGAGHADMLAFDLYEDQDAAVDDWVRGRLDVARVPPGRIPEAVTMGAAFVRTPSSLLQYVGLPLRSPPFDDPVVRRAVAMCIDRQRIVTDVFHGIRPLANRIVPPPLLAGTADEDLTGVRYDPASARRMLAAQGVARLPPTEFRYGTGLGHDAWVAAVVGHLRRELDWAIELRPTEWADLVEWSAAPDALFNMTWGVDFPSVDNVLYPLLHSDSLGAGNHGFVDERVDRLITEARATPDAADRRRLYAAAERAACEQLPLIPLWFGVDCHLVRTDRFEIDGPAVDALGDPALRSYRPVIIG